MYSDTSAALRDADLTAKKVQQDPHWAYGGGKREFLLRLEDIGITYEQISHFCRANQRPIPEKMGKDQRERLLVFLCGEENRNMILGNTQEAT